MKQENKKHPQIKLTGRVITGTKHTTKIKEKLESEEQEKKERKGTSYIEKTAEKEIKRNFKQ